MRALRRRFKDIAFVAFGWLIGLVVGTATEIGADSIVDVLNWLLVFSMASYLFLPLLISAWRWAARAKQ